MSMNGKDGTEIDCDLDEMENDMTNAEDKMCKRKEANFGAKAGPEQNKVMENETNQNSAGLMKRGLYGTIGSTVNRCHANTS